MRLCKNCPSTEKCEDQHECEKKRKRKTRIEEVHFLESLQKPVVCIKSVCDCDKKECS